MYVCDVYARKEDEEMLEFPQRRKINIFLHDVLSCMQIKEVMIT